jgi:hypothetical protein
MIFIFSLIYYSISADSFTKTRANQDARYIDCLFLSTTIQATVGLPDIVAITDKAKICIMVQQYLSILSMIFLVVILGKIVS